MTPASGKAKGRWLQNWIVQLILERFQSLDPDDVTSRSMGCNGEDVLMSSKARAKFPFSIEAKNAEKHNVFKAYGQACANCGDDHEPLLIIKKNRSQPLAVVSAEWMIRNWRSK
jgi:hypothetical protein